MYPDNPENYNSLCDVFYTNARVGSHMRSPHDRSTMVSFYERMQKLVPDMLMFNQDAREGDCTMKEDPDAGSYRWITVGANALSCGWVSPVTPDEGHGFGASVLETAPYYLSISPVDMEYLEVLWGFDFRCKLNHHEIIAEALLTDGALGSLMDIPDAKAVHFGFSLAVGLSPDVRTQFRILVQPRTFSSQVKSGQYGNEPLSVMATMRQWAGGKKHASLHDLHQQLVQQAAPLIEDRLVKPIVMPIREAIARHR